MERFVKPQYGRHNYLGKLECRPAKLQRNNHREFICTKGWNIITVLKADGSVDNNTYITGIREINDEFSASDGQTRFTLSHRPSEDSNLKMFINGIRISNSAYNVSGNSVTYLPANNGSNNLRSGDRIQFDYYY